MEPGVINDFDPIIARTVQIDDDRPLLDLFPGGDGIAWIRRGEGMVAWGEGSRVTATGPDRIRKLQAFWRAQSEYSVVEDEVGLPGTGLVAFGSFAFADDSADESSLYIPTVAVGRRDGVTWLTTIDATPTGVDPRAVALPEAEPPTPVSGVTIERGDESEWKAAVDRAVGRIGAGEVHKVVLARSVTAQADAPIDLRGVVASLAEGYPTAWAFHVDGMVGATPELLARVDKGLVTSRVLAGTIRPTGDEQADLAHAAELARSSKDREEHEYAVRSVTDVLDGFCSSINVPEAPSVIHLPNVMHLASDVTGVLREPTSSLELVAALHPSAAVCGTPRDAASRVITDLETIDRGRYAGPVGWIDGNGDGEWCIALRAAEVDADDPARLRLFAGCGIVAASDSHAEWEESEAKLEPLRSALRG